MEISDQLDTFFLLVVLHNPQEILKTEITDVSLGGLKNVCLQDYYLLH